MKKYVLEIIATVVLAVLDVFVVKYLTSKDMNEMTWLSIFLAGLFIAVIWGYGILLGKIDIQKKLTAQFYNLYIEGQKHFENSVKTHLIATENLFNGIIDSVNGISAKIVNENLKDPSLKPPLMSIKTDSDERITILAEKAKADLEKLRIDFEKALKL